MSQGPKGEKPVEFADGTSESGDKQVLGRQLWRIFPYIKPYRKRFALGIISNAAARAFDLLPFVAMGLLTDAVLSGDIQELRGFAFYGLLILGSFTGLAIFQGISNLKSRRPDAAVRGETCSVLQKSIYVLLLNRLR